MKGKRSKCLPEHPENRTIVIALVQLCKSLGLKVIAEGIEDTQTASVLREMNCDVGQGFLFGSPKSASEYDVRQSPIVSSG